MKIKTHCLHCGKFFIHNRVTGQYCSGKCRTAAWRERQKSPLFQVAKSFIKAKKETSPNGRTCPVCKSQAVTDNRFGFCQAGHLWSLDGLYQKNVGGKELWQMLNKG